MFIHPQNTDTQFTQLWFTTSLNLQVSQSRRIKKVGVDFFFFFFSITTSGEFT